MKFEDINESFVKFIRNLVELFIGYVSFTGFCKKEKKGKNLTEIVDINIKQHKIFSNKILLVLSKI
jgi:tRNA U38,U39,U40 pseudouridine synthase TruA